MKKVILFAAGLTFLAGCTNQNTSMKGLDLTNLDTTVAPAEDFYQYATGGWQAKNPLPDEYARYGSFDKLGEDNQKQVRKLIEDLSKKKNTAGSNADKVGTLYKLGMDEARLNKEGAEPIQAELASIMEITDLNSFMEEFYKLQGMGLSPYFGVFASADRSNSKMNIAWVNQASLPMGDSDYYFLDDERSQQLREAYKNYVKKVFVLSGFTANVATEMTDAVMRVETKLAKEMLPRKEFRNPHTIFNKMPVEKLQTMAPAIDWNRYFEVVGAKDVKELSVAPMNYMSKISQIFQNTPIEELKAQLAFYYINTAAPYLSKDFTDARFEYYGKTLRGTEVEQPRWKTMVNVVNSTLGEAVAQEYVKIYFPAEAKTRMVELVDNLKTAFGERIQNLEWMSAETKVKAMEKMGTFRVKIGYPDEWRDYSALAIDEKESYFANILRAIKFEHDYSVEEIDKPLDPTKWLMNAHEVNAYYSPVTNEICFPAGILQPPFFFMEGDDALNYGAIGVVIAHEMTHGFDDQGRKSDKDGNLVDWWTAEDASRFDERAQVLVDHFNAIEVAPGVYADGKFSLGENIADNGGVQISFHAFQKTEQYKENKPIDNLTPAQRFFISYAGVWAGNIREQEILRRTKEDEHSLGRWRVNGTLPHVSAFEEAFDIKPGDKMYLAPEKRADIW